MTLNNLSSTATQESLVGLRSLGFTTNVTWRMQWTVWMERGWTAETWELPKPSTAGLRGEATTEELDRAHQGGSAEEGWTGVLYFETYFFFVISCLNKLLFTSKVLFIILFSLINFFIIFFYIKLPAIVFLSFIIYKSFIHFF